MGTLGRKTEVWKIALRLADALLFPPSRRRFRILWRTIQLQLKLVFDLARNREEAFGDLMENWANLQEEELSSVSQEDDLANVRPILIDMLKILKQARKEQLIPLFYIYETSGWIQAVLGQEDQQGVYENISKRVKRVLEGRTKPLFIPFMIPDPDNELVEYLKSGDATRSVEHIEKIPFERVLLLIPNDSALVHLVATDDGTFSIITQKSVSPEIVLCRSFTRQRVEDLLRGWMWLYYWHREDIYTRAAERVIQQRKIPDEDAESFKEAYQRIPYELLFHNQALFDHLQPTEIPASDGIPEIPFPSWLVMEAILRELGKGDLVLGEGMWQGIEEKLSLHEIRRIILCPDKILALFPHHGAILNIDRDGQKECMLDRHEITYLPHGTLDKVAPVKPKSPRLFVFGTDGEELLLVGIANLRSLAPEFVSEWHVSKGDEPSEKRKKFIEETSKVNAITFLGHGKYNWEDPSQSFLGLLRDRSGEGFNDLITLENFIEQIPSRLNLIVLAGCETGLPKITTPASEHKGFAEDLLSGCRASAIVSTLWPVPSVPTVLLMCQFHKCWLLGDGEAREKPLPPVSALRKAQLWLRALTREQVVSELEALASVQPSEVINKEIQALGKSIVERPYAHPYFWSAYYVMGGVSWIR